MIVVDTNIIAGLLLPTEWTGRTEQLLAAQPEWAAPVLWRSEFRNILATYVRSERLELETALRIAETAEGVLAGREFSVDSASVLRLAAQSRCSAYDCEFVALAQHLGIRLVTVDRQLLAAFPTVAVDLEGFASDA